MTIMIRMLPYTSHSTLATWPNFEVSLHPAHCQPKSCIDDVLSERCIRIFPLELFGKRLTGEGLPEISVIVTSICSEYW